MQPTLSFVKVLRRAIERVPQMDYFIANAPYGVAACTSMGDQNWRNTRAPSQSVDQTSNQVTNTGSVQDTVIKSSRVFIALHCIGLWHDHRNLCRCPYPQETAENVGRDGLLSGRCRLFQPCTSLARGLVSRVFSPNLHRELTNSVTHDTAGWTTHLSFPCRIAAGETYLFELRTLTATRYRSGEDSPR